MFVVTREMYHTEMAEAVYEHLRNFLLGMVAEASYYLAFVAVVFGTLREFDKRLNPSA